MSMGAPMRFWARAYRNAWIVTVIVFRQHTSCNRTWPRVEPIAVPKGQYTLPELGPSHASHFSTPLIDPTRIRPSTRFELHVGPGDVLWIRYVDTGGTLVDRLLPDVVDYCSKLRNSFKRDGATGFVKCMSKPAASARARSSLVPQPDTATMALRWSPSSFLSRSATS